MGTGRTTTTSTAVERPVRQTGQQIRWASRKKGRGQQAVIRVGCAKMVDAYLCMCMCIHGHVSPMRWFFYCYSPFFQDYLTAKQQFDHDHVCVKSRLHKKLKVFVESELPLLLEEGYLIDNIAVIRNTSKALVAQPGRGLHRYDIENKNRLKVS